MVSTQGLALEIWESLLHWNLKHGDQIVLSGERISPGKGKGPQCFPIMECRSEGQSAR